MSADTTGAGRRSCSWTTRPRGCGGSPSTAPTSATPSATRCAPSSTRRCTPPTATPTSASPIIRGAGRASRRATTSSRACRRVSLLHRGRRRDVVTPRGRGLVAHLGPRQAGDRAGARLRDGGRHRARGRLRPRVRRRGRAAQLPRRAGGQPARLPVPRLAGRHAAGDGADADRRCDRRTRGGPHRHGQPRVSRGRARARDAGDGRARGVDPDATCCRSTSAPCTGRWSSRACARRRAPARSCRGWRATWRRRSSSSAATCRPRSSKQPSRSTRERRYFLNATGL